jgi:hypothetical protein
LHSSYANSYVNISIFESTTTREHVQQLIGAPVERLVFLFCAVPRHKLIHEELHFRYTDAELADHLAASDMSIKAARENGTFDTSEPWRKKLCSLQFFHQKALKRVASKLVKPYHFRAGS